ncbi:hypothetical protein AB0L53_49695 [Nonomuraea sp. NPDC052129]|uniref:TolB family protein n=1 Tax=Nonomuraea sp. NPDC052129 TaxID=3154651 RepID=UPI00341895BF
MNEVEETLRRTFGQAAEQAPRLPGMLPQRLERVHLRRRRRSRMALAAAAVVLVSGGTLAVVRGGETTTAVQGEVASQGQAEAPAEPVEKVWPEAVLKVAGKGYGGTAWQPATVIDDRTVLMTTRDGFASTAAIYAYDLETAAQRKIADVPRPAGTVSFASDFAVGGGHVAWWTATEDSVARLWAVPLEGGEAKIVADQRVQADDDGNLIDGLEVVNDKIVFSVRPGGVFTVPLGGGTVEPIAESAGMHLLTWPWAGTPGPGGQPKTGPVGERTEGPLYERIRNLETGETATAVVHADEQLRSCGVRICLGTTSSGESFYRQRDGSQERKAIGYPLMLEPPTQDRFSFSSYGPQPAGVGLYDLVSGKSASLGIKPEGNAIRLPMTDSTGRILSYSLGDDLYMIDLSRIR